MRLDDSAGLKLYLVGTALILFFALVDPKSLIVAAGPAGFLFAFGGMLASGKFPSPPKDMRNKRLLKKLKRDRKY